MQRFFLIYFLFLFYGVSAQPEYRQINVLFYNVENLFDTEDNSQAEDNEFLPQGDRHWTSFRLTAKLNSLSKVILNSAGFEPPEIIGLCEIENRSVLEQLIQVTPLNKFDYTIIHKDSPDERGIDVAILYRRTCVTPIRYHYIPLIGTDNDTLQTREILHSEFLLADKDTLHFFVNHWPSRYGGQAETESDRIHAALTLRKEVNERLAKNSCVKILIMGDLNDQPQDRSVVKGLGAQSRDTDLHGELINLSAHWEKGTIKYRQTWSVFDQVIVSDQLLQVGGYHTSLTSAKIVDLPFLFQKDQKYKGRKLFRTYNGFHYTGGFSDHLPVLIELEH